MVKHLLVVLISLYSIAFTFGQEAKTINVSGVVLDKKSNEPLVGVTVTEKGSTTGTITDIDGKFTLKVSSQNSIISISYIGYKTFEQVVGNQSVFNIGLEEDTRKLDEVLVTAVSIKKEKKEIGYAIQELKSQEILDAKETNLVNALNSKVAGVQVTSSSGSPGAAARIRLRGSTSITQNNDPLFVVDGIPIDNTGGENTRTLESSNRAIDINPDDIANMTILKGPAATALYGIRASNGAIIITTKSGQSGKTTFNFSSSFGIDVVNKLPERQTKFAGGSDGVFRDFPDRVGKVSSDSWGPSFGDPSLPSEVKYYDNIGNFFTTGTQRNHYLSLSGGNEKSTYYLSLGNFKQTGVVPNQEFERFSLKIANTQQVFKFLKISGSLNYNNSRATRLRKGGNWSAPMISLFRGTSDFDNTNGKSDPVNDPTAYLVPGDTAQRKGSGYDNPFFSVNKNKSTEEINRLIGYSQFDITITPWLSLMARVGADLISTGSTENYDKRSAENHQEQSFKGSYYESQSFKRDINTDLILSAQKKVSKDFELGLRLGHNYWDSESKRMSLEGYNYKYLEINDFSNTNDYEFQFARITKKAIMASYIDGKIGFRGYINLNFTGRLEQASTLPKSGNTFFYPSANMAFVLSDFIREELKFSLPESGLTYLKIRAAFAQVGNLPNPYLTSTYYSKGSINKINGEAIYNLDLTRGNASIKPEVSTTQEFGLETKFLRNRLGFDISYYNTLNSNQIIRADVAPSTGYSSAWLNGGKIKNTGIEIVAYGTPIKGSLTWDASVNFTRQRTEVVELIGNFQYVGNGAGFDNGSNAAYVGYQYGVFTSPQRFQRLGQDPNDLSIRKDLPIVVDANGQPVIETSPKSFYIVGNPNPDWFAGIRNTFTWKGLSLSVLIDIRKGGDIFNLTRYSMTYFGQHKDTENRNTPYVIPNSVYADGTPNNTPILRNFSYYKRFSENGNVGELAVEDGSWIRGRELTLKYTFPDQSIKFLKNLSLSFTARNLFLITKYSGVDPETNAAGNDPSLGKDAYNQPNTKSFILTLNATF